LRAFRERHSTGFPPSASVRRPNCWIVSMTDLIRPVRRALLSVSDKTGLITLGEGLARHGVEL